MPLFMMLVGYFSQSLLSVSFFTMLGKRLRQLILPAITFTIILLVCGFYEINTLKELFSQFIFSFWFLKSAFACTVFFYIFSVNQRFRFVGIALSLILSQFLGLFFFNIMYPCFILGFILSNHRLFWDAHKKIFAAIFGIVWVFLLLFFDERFWQIPPLTLARSSPLFYEYWFKIGYKLIIGIVGSLFFFSLFLSSKVLADNVKKKPIIQYIGKNTLGVYLIQTLIIEKILMHYLKFDGLNFWVFNFIVTPMISLVVLFICIGIIRLLKKNRWLSLLFLGSK